MADVRSDIMRSTSTWDASWRQISLALLFTQGGAAYLILISTLTLASIEGHHTVKLGYGHP